MRNIGLTPTPVGAAHFAEVPVTHIDVAHRLFPIWIVIERLDAPKFKPVSVRDRPPVVARLRRCRGTSLHTSVIVGASYVKGAAVAVPTSAAIVSRTFDPVDLNPDPVGAEQMSCVSDVHESVLHKVPASAVSTRADDEMSASPKLSPRSVTEAEPVVGELMPRPNDTTGASNEKAALSVPSCDVIVRVIVFADPTMLYAIAYRLHCSVVVDVHETEKHEVEPTRAVGVVSLAPAKSRPLIVTAVERDVGEFDWRRNEASGASKEKTDNAVPSELDATVAATINAACR
jgi:hypothetical protein